MLVIGAGGILPLLSFPVLAFRVRPPSQVIIFSGRLPLPSPHQEEEKQPRSYAARNARRHFLMGKEGYNILLLLLCLPIS